MPVEINSDSELPQLILWITEHDGVIEERWKTQWRFNEARETFEKDLKKKLDKITTQLNVLQSKIAFYAGGAALAGSFIVALAQWFLNQSGT